MSMMGQDKNKLLALQGVNSLWLYSHSLVPTSHTLPAVLLYLKYALYISLVSSISNASRTSGVKSGSFILCFFLLGSPHRHKSIAYRIQYLAHCSKRRIAIRRKCLIKSFSGNSRFLCSLGHTFCSCYCTNRLDKSRRDIQLHQI